MAVRKLHAVRNNLYTDGNNYFHRKDNKMYYMLEVNNEYCVTDAELYDEWEIVSFSIESIYAGAWNNAIEQIATKINEAFSSKVDVSEWDKLEQIARLLELRFDVDGNIVKEK